MNAPSWRRTGAGTRRAQHQPGAAQARAQRARMPRRRRRGLRSYRVTHMALSRVTRSRALARFLVLSENARRHVRCSCSAMVASAAPRKLGGGSSFPGATGRSRRRQQEARSTVTGHRTGMCTRPLPQETSRRRYIAAGWICTRLSSYDDTSLQTLLVCPHGRREKKGEEKEECGNEWHKQTKRRARRRGKGLSCTRRCLPTTRHE